MPRIPIAVRTLLIVTVAAFILQQLADRQTQGMFTYLFGLSRAGLMRGSVWQLVTYVFLHGGVWHILINMLVLAVFGRELEEVLGTGRFVSLYLGCGVLAGLGWLLISGWGPGLCIGASGAVFGIVGTFAALFPQRRITLLLLLVFPVTMTARTLAVLSALIAFVSLFASDGNIAHAAHLAGGVAGYLYGLRLRRIGVQTWEGWTFPSRPGPFGGPLHTRKPEGGEGEGSPTREEIDALLDKIHEQGIGSLSRKERDRLDRASRG